MSDELSRGALAALVLLVVVLGLGVAPFVWQWLWGVVAVGWFGAAPLDYWIAFGLCALYLAIRGVAWFYGPPN